MGVRAPLPADRPLRRRGRGIGFQDLRERLLIIGGDRLESGPADRGHELAADGSFLGPRHAVFESSQHGVAQPVQYQTVTPTVANAVCPANGAAVRLMTLPNITYRKNLAFAPEFMTMATADLILPPNLQEGSRAEYDGVAMRALTQYQAGTDVLISRLDVIYGAVIPRGEWASIVPDITP